MQVDGIIIINKEQNMTSHDVVGKMRRILGTGKIGHTGTLDPMATGVLPICVGKATRIIEYLDMDFKTYRCTMALGKNMDTQDAWGKEISRVTEKKINAVDETMVKEALSKFNGLVNQKPPIYSALKVNGKKLYEYARAGETVEIKSRDIFIKSITIDAMELGKGYDSNISFTVTCSKGTYIRAICHDVGIELGTFGFMKSLERTQSGNANLENSIKLDELAEMNKAEIKEKFLAVESLISDFGEIILEDHDIKRFTNGMRVWSHRCKIVREPKYKDRNFVLPVRDEFSRAYITYGRVKGVKTFLGISFMDKDGENIKADKVFYQYK